MVRGRTLGTGGTPSRRAATLDRAFVRRLTSPSGTGDAGHAVDAGPASVRRRAAVLLVQAPVHLAAPAALAGALLLLASGASGLGVLLVGVLLLLAVGSWPRRRRRPDPVASLVAADAPRTFAVLEQVATHVGSPAPGRMTVTSGLGAEARRRLPGHAPELVVGAVGWAGLTPEARVALVAHELAHVALPELRLARTTRRAEVVLEEWRLICGGEVARRGADAEDARRFVVFLSAFFLAPVRLVVVAWSRTLVRLQAPVTAYGELLADRLATEAAGRAALQEVWDLGLGAATWETALTRGLSRHDDLAATVREAVRAVPPDAVARRRATADGNDHRVDEEHPATHLRRRALESSVVRQPVVTVSDAALRASEAELRPTLQTALREAAQALRYTPAGTALGRRSSDSVRRQTVAQNELSTGGGGGGG